jgi:HSP20 family protein
VKTTFHFLEHKGAVARGPESAWVPNTDVYEADGGIVVNVELAGIRREDLQLVVEENRLRIRGERPDQCRDGKCRFLIMEINYGPFECEVELPQGYDLSSAKAVYQNGFLRIDVPAAAKTGKRSSVPVG